MASAMVLSGVASAQTSDRGYVEKRGAVGVRKCDLAALPRRVRRNHPAHAAMFGEFGRIGDVADTTFTTSAKTIANGLAHQSSGRGLWRALLGYFYNS